MVDSCFCDLGDAILAGENSAVGAYHSTEDKRSADRKERRRAFDTYIDRVTSEGKKRQILIMVYEDGDLGISSDTLLFNPKGPIPECP